MRKRVAEKVISRAILGLAVYSKGTMDRALRRRPRFWTEEKTAAGPNTRRALRLRFAETQEESRFRLDYEPGALLPPAADDAEPAADAAPAARARNS